MATTALTLNAERWLDEVLLLGQGPADVGGATLAEFFSLPAGLGDVAIMSCIIRIANVDAGPVAVITPRGVSVRIFSRDAAKVIDLVGVAPWLLASDGANTLEFHAYLDPDALVLCRQDELISILSPEIDSDATPTGDLVVYFKCVRVRPIEAPAGQGPIQLVRSL